MATNGDGRPRCANCGQPLGTAAKRCIYCSAVPGRLCPACKTVTPVGAAVCFACKSPIPPSVPNFILRQGSPDPESGQPAPEPPRPPLAKPSVRRQRRRILLPIAGVVVLCAAVFGGVRLYRAVLLYCAEADALRLLARYNEFLDDAKTAIHADKLDLAAARLNMALSLPDTLDKSAAQGMINDLRTIAQPLGSFVEALSDADLQTICETRTPPPARQLTFPPLNARYQERILRSCDNERVRRQQAAEAERKKKLEAARAAREEQERKVAAEKAAAAPKEAQAGVPPKEARRPVLAEAPQPGWLLMSDRGGIKMTGKVAGCDGKNVLLKIGESTFAKPFRIEDVEDIGLVAADTDVIAELVRSSLLRGNGPVAYRVACLGKELDARLVAVASDPDFSKAAEEFFGARATVHEMTKTLRNLAARKATVESAIQLWDQYGYSLAHPESWPAVSSRQGYVRVQPAPPRTSKPLAALRQDQQALTGGIQKAQAEVDRAKAGLAEHARTVSALVPATLKKAFPELLDP